MNELIFLGTGAADWSRKKREAYFRRKSAALLNGTLLLDCGPHIWDYVQCCDRNILDGVTDVLITHDHDDHLDKESVLRLAEKRRIRVACDGYARLLVGEHENIEYVPVTPFEPFRLGEYAVMPVLANHDVVQQGARQACHYIVRTPNRKTMLYALDGAWFLRPSWEEMKRHRFDVMVLECTVGNREDCRIFEHNNVPMLRYLVQEIRAEKLLTKDGVVVASHLSRNLHDSPEETVALLREADILTACDGMTLRF